ncbi:MAG: DUF2264 domain-containing protein [Opitutales bacterium]|nr:DUF2264 domain-containing protein [Opitutales bacterium]
MEWKNVDGRKNRFSTRADWEALALRYWAAARPHLTVRPGRWLMAYHPAGHSLDGAEMEGWSRHLWALVPLMAGGGRFPDTEILLEGLAAGVDPEHPSYWGRFGSCDQRMVESAVIGAALRMCPEIFWEPLPEHSREQLVDFLDQINRHEPADNNWLFFRVLVNCGLRHVGAPVDEALQSATLDRIESFAVEGSAWYTDGSAGRTDYYNPTGFHFYGLLYSLWEAERDPDRAARLRDRALAFAPVFLRWFDRHGAAVPYGRSLTYRFAQGAFWAALAWAGGGPYSQGQLKGLLARHMRWWQERPIHLPGGTLSRGYGYPQDAMTETYNAVGSPAWGFKIFWALALAEGHPFWSAAEEPLPEDTAPAVQPVARMVFSRDSRKNHAVVVCAGQEPGRAVWMRHFEEKYAKFAYSSQLAFSVPVARGDWTNLAPDSALLLRRSDGAWIARATTEEFSYGDDWVRSTWRIDERNRVETTLSLKAGTQTRRHVFHLGDEWEVVEGGFAVPLEGGANPVGEPGEDDGAQALSVSGGDWRCRLIMRAGGGSLEAGALGPGSHLLFPLAQLPVRRATLAPGRHEWTTVVEAECRKTR